MRNRLLRIVVAASPMVVVFGHVSCQLAHAYGLISPYRVTFEVVPNCDGELWDVRVTLEAMPHL